MKFCFWHIGFFVIELSLVILELTFEGAGVPIITPVSFYTLMILISGYVLAIIISRSFNCVKSESDSSEDHITRMEVLILTYAFHIAILAIVQTIVFSISFLRIGLILEGFGEVIALMVVHGPSKFVNNFKHGIKSKSFIALFILSMITFAAAIAVTIVTVKANPNIYECKSDATLRFGDE